MEIVIQSFDGSKREIFSDVITEIFRDIPFDKVYLSVPHASGVKLSTFSDCSVFYINIWTYIVDENTGAGINGEADHKYVKAWDYEIPMRDRSFKSSGLGTPIITPEGDEIAEFLSPNVLNIHVDLCHFGRSSEQEIFKRILQATLAPINDVIAVDSARQRDMFEKSLASFQTVFNNNAAKEMASLRNTIASSDRVAADYLNQYKISCAKRLNAVIQLDALEGAAIQQFEKFQEEMESILRLDKVERIVLSAPNSCIYVYTTMMYIVSEGERFKIGKFKIQISTATGDIRFYNLLPEYRRKGHWTDHDPHPHVSGESHHACFGTISSSTAELVTEGEYSALATLLISYLESVNLADGAGMHLFEWDSVDEDDNVITAGGLRKICPHCRRVTFKSKIHKCAGCHLHEVCEECGHPYQASEESETEYYCDKCWDRRMYTCDHCHRTVDAFKEGGLVTCNMCSKQLCPTCDKGLKEAGVHYCPDCFGRHFRGYCNHCHTPMKKYTRNCKPGLCPTCTVLHPEDATGVAPSTLAEEVAPTETPEAAETPVTPFNAMDVVEETTPEEAVDAMEAVNMAEAPAPLEDIHAIEEMVLPATPERTDIFAELLDMTAAERRATNDETDGEEPETMGANDEFEETYPDIPGTEPDEEPATEQEGEEPIF